LLLLRLLLLLLLLLLQRPLRARSTAAYMKHYEGKSRCKKRF
jgi:hypothetical protein